MKPIVVTQEIGAPRERVFELAIDFEGAAERVRGIERLELLTDKPVGVGARWRETRVVLGKESTEELTITRFDPPSGYTAECETCGCRYTSTLRLEPHGESRTLATFECDSQPLTLFARLMSPLGALMAGSMKKLFAEDLEDLRRAAEL